MNPRRFQSYLLLFGIFALGAASGGAGAFAFFQKDRAAFLNGDERGWVENRRTRALSRRLGLDSRQEEQVGRILSDNRDAFRSLSRTMFEQCGEPLRRHKGRVDAEIRGILRAEQQHKFDTLLEERREQLLLRPAFGDREWGGMK